MTAIVTTSAGKASPRSGLRMVGVTLGLAAILLTLVAGYGRYRFGSVPASLAYLRGAAYFVDKPMQSLESGHAEMRVPLCYRLTNLTGRPVGLVGVTTTCTCTEIAELPKTIGAGETIAIRATIKVGGGKPSTTGRIRLFTDEIHFPEIVLDFSVRVAKTDSSRLGRAE